MEIKRYKNKKTKEILNEIDMLKQAKEKIINSGNLELNNETMDHIIYEDYDEI